MNRVNSGSESTKSNRKRYYRLSLPYPSDHNEPPSLEKGRYGRELNEEAKSMSIIVSILSENIYLLNISKSTQRSWTHTLRSINSTILSSRKIHFSFTLPYRSQSLSRSPRKSSPDWGWVSRWNSNRPFPVCSRTSLHQGWCRAPV